MKNAEISLIMAIHNEAEYLDDSLRALRRLEGQMSELIIILDKCTDNSKDLVNKYFPYARIIEKNVRSWKNSYAENLQIGLKISIGDIICIHDADIRSPPELFSKLLEELNENVKSVSPVISTYKNASTINFFYHYWEKTRRIAPLGEEPRGGVRLIMRDCLNMTGGFRDVIAPDTQLDIDLHRLGYQSILCRHIVCLHLRKISLRKSINNQIISGEMRRQIGMPFWRVLGHTLMRLRPFVLYGYFKGTSKDEERKT